MAAIGTIRKYSGLAVGLIGISIAAFIISDAFQSNSNLFQKNKMDVGIIDEEVISYQDFHNRYEFELDRYKSSIRSEAVDQETRDQIREEVWKIMEDEIIYGKEYEKTGLTFSSEELTYKVSGPNPHEYVKRFFTNNETQEFDRNQLVGFLKNMDEYPEYKEYWLQIEEAIAKETKRQKYFNLIKAGLNVTDIEAKENHIDQNKYASFDYVALPYREIADSNVEVTDEQIKKYYHKHKDDYEIEQNRSFDFVVWDILPTSNDSLAQYNDLANIITDFANTKNDSAFVELRSDGDFDTIYRNPGHYGENIDYVYLSLMADDSIVGPYYEDNAYKLAKLVDRKMDTVFSYKASHILIKPKGSTDADTLEAMKRARELMTEAKNGADFSLLAMRNSEDKGSAIKGGDLGWFKAQTMVKPFADAVKKMKKGDYSVVKSQFGAHLIKCTEDPNNTLLKVGIIEVKITPSEETRNRIYSQVNKFRSNVKSIEEFENYVNENGLNKQIASEIMPGDREVPGLAEGGQLVSWAYRSKVGEISDAFSLNDQYVVAVLTEVLEDGPAPLEKVRDEVKMKVLQENKQKMLEEKMLDAKGADLESIAQSLATQVEKVTDASFDRALISGLGEEKLLIGYVFGSEPEQLSEPIVGMNAVYRFVLKEFSDVEIPEDLSMVKSQELSNLQGMAQMQTMESLKEMADIKDWRYKWF
jgi:peptidyl-prolyl cis-trans isomerase D